MTIRTMILTPAVVTLALGLGGCQADGTGVEDPMIEVADLLQVAHMDDVLFLSRTAPTTLAPDALFNGRMSVDAAGCIRLETTGDYGLTAVWPHGFTLERQGSALRVLDETGTAVATVGTETALGGGVVAQLGPDLGFTSNDQALANARCPGKFWFVADVL